LRKEKSAAFGNLNRKKKEVHLNILRTCLVLKKGPATRKDPAKRPDLEEQIREVAPEKEKQSKEGKTTVGGMFLTRG